jgi:hypothetical protein
MGDGQRGITRRKKQIVLRSFVIRIIAILAVFRRRDIAYPLKTRFKR